MLGTGLGPALARARTPARAAIAALLAVLLWPATAHAAEQDPSVPLLVSLALILIFAKLGGELALRLRIPSVVGELAVGIGLGAAGTRVAWIPDFAHDPTLDLLARLGVVLLLFAVGLESTVPQMFRVGRHATQVALTGVVLPMIAGYGLSLLLLGGAAAKGLFLGAALCATSIGISARVLRDARASSSEEARIIVGAAVIDDVLGLVVLTIVSGIAQAGGAVEAVPILKVMASASGVLLAGVLGGMAVANVTFRIASRLRAEEIALPLSLAFAFALAAASTLGGLAPIVGAYAAGLILEPVHFRSLRERGEEDIERLVHPIVQLFAPIFFVIMGTRVDPSVLGDPRVWAQGIALALVGTVAKLAAGWSVPRPLDRLVIGLGMVPRGEVGLIFAAVGRTLRIDGVPLLTDGDYASIVLMVILTTFAGPTLLGVALRRSSASAQRG